jgi:hypothetical protein
VKAGWLPPSAILTPSFGVMLAQGRLMTSRDWVIATGASVALFSIGAAYAVRHPERGLQDRLAGTTLVPR